MWTVSGWYEEARRKAEKDAVQIAQFADHLLKHYQDSLPGKSRAEISALLSACNEERLKSTPDLALYPELRGMRPLIEAEWRGTRDGAGLTDEQSAAYSNGNFYYHRYLASGRNPPTGCSYIYFPHSDHGPILANNLDSVPDEPFGPPAWPLLNEFVIVGGVSSGVFEDEESPEIFPAPVEKLVARYCRNTGEAVDMLTRYNHFWGPKNALVVDCHGRTAMIEKSACRIGVRWSPDGFGFITAMTAEEPAMRAFLEDRRAHSLVTRGLPVEHPDRIYWRGADARRELMTELLDEARKNPTLETIRRFIQFRDARRGKVCYNGELLYPGGTPLEFTLRTSIWLLREGRALWWAKEGDTPSYENRKPDLAFKDVPVWA